MSDNTPSSSPNSQPIPQPAAVEAVLRMTSYPSDLVVHVYQHLSAGSATDVTGPGRAAGAAGAAVGKITAVMLVQTIDDIQAGRLSIASVDPHAEVPSLASLPAGGAASVVAGRQATTGDLQQDGDKGEEEKQSSPGRTQPSRDLHSPQPHPDPSGHSPASVTSTEAAPPSQAMPATTGASSASHTREVGFASQVAAASSPLTVNSVQAAAATEVGGGAVSAAVPAPSPALQAPASVDTTSQQTQPAANTQTSTHTSPVYRSATTQSRDTTRTDVDRARQKKLQRLRALRVENRRLKARQTCRQCHQRPVALTFLPCGHFTFCQECGSSFDACPVCRKTILADVRTFVS